MGGLDNSNKKAKWLKIWEKLSFLIHPIWCTFVPTLRSLLTFAKWCERKKERKKEKTKKKIQLNLCSLWGFHSCFTYILTLCFFGFMFNTSVFLLSTNPFRFWLQRNLTCNKTVDCLDSLTQQLFLYEMPEKNLSKTWKAKTIYCCP